MATNIKTLTESNGDILLPRTTTTAITVTGSGENLDTKLSNIKDDIDTKISAIGGIAEEPIPRNADTLNGYDSNHYASKSEVSAQLADIENYVGLYADLKFIKGNVLANGITFTSSVEFNNVITPEIIAVKGLTIKVSDPAKYRYKIFYYNNNGTFINGSNWMSTETVITDSANIRIGLCLYENVGIGVDLYTVDEMKSNLILLKEKTVYVELVEYNAEKAKVDSVLSPYLEEFAPLKIMVTGDSITDVLGSASKKWPVYLAEWFGFDVINDGKSATGLIRANGGTPGIYTRIDTWDVNYDDFDMVLIMGNMNDGGLGPSAFPVGNFTDSVATASQYGALHATIQKLLTKYPNKPIGWIISTPRLASASYPAPHNGKAWGTDSWFEPYCQAILKVCEHYSIPCLDLYHSSGLRPYNPINNLAYFDQADGVHPNNKGHEIMAYKIYDFVKGFMAGNVLLKTNYAFELGTIIPGSGAVDYSAVVARARMRTTFGEYKPGIFTVNDPAKHNLVVYLFKNPVYNGTTTSGYLGASMPWVAAQRINNPEATHIQLAIRNNSGVDFTPAELQNLNKYITFIPD